MKRFAGFVTLVSSLLMPAIAGASLPEDAAGKLVFRSGAAQTSYSDIYGKQVSLTDEISGELSFPAESKSTYPAIILMHGSGGISAGVTEWAAFYRARGYATFIVNSFEGRGIKEAATDPNVLQYGASVTDGLAALNLLATHPRIDAKRIGISGFSRGGVAALYSSYSRIATQLSEHRFAFHIVFYGGCSYAGTTTGQPILFLMGDEDSYFTADKCAALAKQLTDKGADIQLKTYPGAAHGFDVSNVPRKYLGRLKNTKKCDFNVDVDSGAITLPDNKPGTEAELATYLDNCRAYGVDYGYHQRAHEAAKTDIDQFLARIQ